MLKYVVAVRVEFKILYPCSFIWAIEKGAKRIGFQTCTFSLFFYFLTPTHENFQGEQFMQ